MANTDEAKKAEKPRVEPVRKHISWSHGSATVTIPAEMRDAMGIKPRTRTGVEISLLDSGSGLVIRVVRD